MRKYVTDRFRIKHSRCDVKCRRLIKEVSQTLRKVWRKKGTAHDPQHAARVKHGGGIWLPAEWV